MKKIQELLNRSKLFFIAWCMLAAFGTYFCMYAFRKPFTAGTYAGINLWDIHYKTILIISQVFGYMFSKFIGIKVISELRASAFGKIDYWSYPFCRTVPALLWSYPLSIQFYFFIPERAAFRHGMGHRV